jgi:hypothetical protein
MSSAVCICAILKNCIYLKICVDCQCELHGRLYMFDMVLTGDWIVYLLQHTIEMYNVNPIYFHCI